MGHGSWSMGHGSWSTDWVMGHGVSYSKVLEIESTIANSKLSSSTKLTPNDIQHILTTAVYDNIDGLGEKLSGCGTTNQVNGALVKQAFIDAPLQPVISRMEKTKKQSNKVP